MDFLNYAEGWYVVEGKPTKQLANIKIALRPLAEMFSEIEATDFKPRGLASVRQTFVERKLAPTMINRYNKLIVQAFKHGAVLGSVPAETWTALKALPPILNGRLGLFNP